MNEKLMLSAAPDDVGKRLDLFVKDGCGLTRSAVQLLIENGGVAVNGKAMPKNYLIRSGDEVRVEMPTPVSIDALPEEIPVDIIYQDEHLAVVNKPQGMVVHPAPGSHDKTLVNALLFHMSGSLSGINGKIRPGIVHRIDKNTSGLLVVAKTDRAHEGLAAQIKEHSFTRRYQAIVVGHITPPNGTISKPVGRSVTNRKKMAVYPPGSPNAREAVTHYRTLEEFKGHSLLELQLETGRTHQIRVHLSSLGHPVIGDEVYGGGRMKEAYPRLAGQCLHAKTIGFLHPKTGEVMEFDSALPAYFERELEYFRKL